VQGVREDSELLGNYLGIEIESISQHKPARSSVYEELSEYFVDSYQRDLIYDIYYISDSGCKWRKEDLITSIGQADIMHVLTHPDYWCPQGLNLPEKLKTIAVDKAATIIAEMEACIELNYEYLLRRELMDRERSEKYTESLLQEGKR
jgi:hypothetical protein